MQARNNRPGRDRSWGDLISSYADLNKAGHITYWQRIPVIRNNSYAAKSRPLLADYRVSTPASGIALGFDRLVMLATVLEGGHFALTLSINGMAHRLSDPFETTPLTV